MIPENTAQIFIADPDSLIAPARLEAALSLLDQTERQRHDRFRFDADKRAFAAAHALLRRSLSSFGDIAPDSWRFVSGPHGRPELASPQDASRLRFNLSHSRQLVTCIVTLELDCGVDVERFGRAHDPLGLTERFFHRLEYDYVAGFEGIERDHRFVELWSLKEAYVKAKGLGLHLSLSSFRYEVADDLTVRAHLDPSEEGNDALWSFLLIHADQRHALSAAVKTIHPAPVTFIVEKVDL